MITNYKKFSELPQISIGDTDVFFPIIINTSNSDNDNRLVGFNNIKDVITEHIINNIDIPNLNNYYTKIEVDSLLTSYVPTTRKINGKPLSQDITLDIPETVDLDGYLKTVDADLRYANITHEHILASPVESGFMSVDDKNKLDNLTWIQFQNNNHTNTSYEIPRFIFQYTAFTTTLTGTGSGYLFKLGSGNISETGTGMEESHLIINKRGKDVTFNLPTSNNVISQIDEIIIPPNCAIEVILKHYSGYMVITAIPLNFKI